jgi:glycosyltransferase involved in cell wall biosynthesis
MVLIEAMASARPVVASAVGGAPEIVVDGETGLLVSPGDAVALRDALESLISDPARRARMGEACRRCAPRFTVSAAVDRIERLYVETLAGDVVAGEAVAPNPLSTTADAAGGVR